MSVSLAAWVQAIGSILAIAGAWITVNWQARQERKLEVDRRAHDAAQVQAARAARYAAGRRSLTEALQIARNIKREFDEADGDSARVETSDPLRWALVASDTLEYYATREHDDPSLVGAIAVAKRLFPDLLTQLENYNQSGGHYFRLSSTINTMIQRLSHLIEDLDSGAF
jgi:hypothetical protein